MAKRIPKSKITIELTRYKNEWIITGGDFSTNGGIEWIQEFDTNLQRKFEKEISNVLLKYERPEDEIRVREESIRKMKLEFEGN